MTVTDVRKDHDALTLTITAEFDAPVERVWQLWADPRRLERWWGPPSYPATFTDHDLRPGGAVRYFMTGPEGDRHHGWWTIRSVDEPRSIELDDGFGEQPGDAGGMPVIAMRATFEAAAGGGTQMVVRSTFASAEAMAQLVSMGMDEGMTEAMGQMDDILRADRAA